MYIVYIHIYVYLLVLDQILIQKLFTILFINYENFFFVYKSIIWTFSSISCIYLYITIYVSRTVCCDVCLSIGHNVAQALHYTRTTIFEWATANRLFFGALVCVRFAYALFTIVWCAHLPTINICSQTDRSSNSSEQQQQHQQTCIQSHCFLDACLALLYICIYIYIYNL